MRRRPAPGRGAVDSRLDAAPSTRARPDASGFDNQVVPAAPLGRPVIEQPIAIISTLLATLAGLFAFARHPLGKRLFAVVPLLLFAYFVPTVWSNVGLIPLESPAYGWIVRWLLPASLILLTLSVDLPGIVGLGRPAVILFLTATVGIVIGGPLAYLALGWLVPADLGDQAWKGLAALSGSWIGGGANFVAVGKSVGIDDKTLSMMVVVDVAVASAWMAILLYFAGRSEAMDKRINADDSMVVELRDRVQAFRDKVARPIELADLFALLTIGIGGAVVIDYLAQNLPTNQFVGHTMWLAILATSFGVGLSFTRIRNLEGAGASTIGAVFLYLLVASIGARADFLSLGDAPALVAIGALWMTFHAITILVVRRILRAPIFFAAVGSQANVGGAASAPVVAASFHSALAPVGVLLAVGGYVLGTYAALLCAFFLERIHGVYF